MKKRLHIILALYSTTVLGTIISQPVNVSASESEVVQIEEEQVEATVEEVEEELNEAPLETEVDPVEEVDREETTSEEVVESVSTEEVEEPIEEIQSEEIAVESETLPKTATGSSKKAEPLGTKYYYVKKGDTLYSIASRYNTTVDKLVEWNDLPADYSINVGSILSLNGTNNYDNYNEETATFKTAQEFIDYASPIAEEVAAENGLYASVMIAQTSLETGYGQSGLSKLGNNFFGIKASDSYDGNQIIMSTWEEVDGKKVTIDSAFRFYPSYADSFQDNADKLVNGLYWTPDFYDGTWVENTNSYKDATLFLTQRYATDTKYYSKLNSIIDRYNLTQYDSVKYNETNYDVTLTQEDYDISNLPGDHYNAHNNLEVIDNTSNYIDEKVTVKHINYPGTFANIYKGSKELGWVSVDALQPKETAEHVAVGSPNSRDFDSVRYDGYSRENVAENVAKAHFADSNKVIIVNRDKFSDAISASNISQGDYPVLYTHFDKVSDSTMKQLKAMPLDEVIVLGGELSVSDKVVSQLQSELNVKVSRVAGRSRYDANVASVKSTFDKADHVIIASGEVYADALYGVSYANTLGAPIILSNTKTLESSTIQLLKDLGVKKATIIGGELSVTANVVSQLSNLGITADRISGYSRYEGSVEVAEARKAAPKNLIIASGEVFPDALVASTLSQKIDAPILLVKSDRIEPSVETYINDNRESIENIYFLGGELTISAEVVARILGS